MSAVDLTPLYQALDQVIIVVAGGLVAWAGAEARAYMKKHLTFLDQEEQKTLSDGFERALENGVNIAAHELDRYEGEHSTVEVKGWIQAKAAQYAIDHSPDYMAKFGLSPQDVERKVLAHLPEVCVDPNPVASGSVVTIGGKKVTVGEPSPSGIDEKAETTALNKAQTGGG